VLPAAVVLGQRLDLERYAEFDHSHKCFAHFIGHGLVFLMGVDPLASAQNSSLAALSRAR
jgi:hypothetical protein